MRKSPPSAGAAIQGPDLSKESDADLIEIMGWDESDPVYARAAWSAFYLRHLKRVLWLCRRSSDPENLAQEVFRRVKASAAGFDLGPMRGESDEGKQLNILLTWVGRIIHSILQDEYRDMRRFGTAYDPTILQEHGDPKCPDPLDVLTGGRVERREHVRQLIEALLSPEQREVLRVSMVWYDPDHTRCYLPPKVLGELIERLKTTKENIRRLRKTALDLIRAALEAEENASPAAN